MMPSALCRSFASILGGTAQVLNGVCTVTKLRTNLRPLIEGRRTNSALAIPQLFSFEDLDSRGNALNLGETVILQEEVNPFITQLRMRGIEVTAFHNHWLFENPRLMYMHFKSVEPPLEFARKVAAASKVLTTRTVYPTRTEGSSGTKGTRGTNGSAGMNRSRGTNGSAGMNRSRGVGGSFGMNNSRGCAVCSASSKSAKTKAAPKKSAKSRSVGAKTKAAANKARIRSASSTKKRSR